MDLSLSVGVTSMDSYIFDTFDAQPSRRTPDERISVSNPVKQHHEN